MTFKFKSASANDSIVFGAERPGYPSRSVNNESVREWISFMKASNIKRICCLLEQEQLAYYRDNLLPTYRKEFGDSNVCWAPVADYQLADISTLKQKILPFLAESDTKQERVVVHCSGGSGRTGHVLAAWLVHGRGFEVEDALSEVINGGRQPGEAVYCGCATESQLYNLLNKCRRD